MIRSARVLALSSLAAALACAKGGGSEPISAAGLEAEIVCCRSWIESPHNNTEIRSSTVRALADTRVINRAGIELGVRVHLDSNFIVYTRERDFATPQSREIFTATMDASAPELRLTANRAIDDAPCWSPDGGEIVFSSTRGGAGRRLWRMTPEGRDARPVHDDGMLQTDPDWSGAAERIVYSAIDPAAVSPRARLFTIDPDGRMPVLLSDGGSGSATETVPGDYEPAYSPDGTRVVFSRVVGDGQRRLMMLNLNTAELTTLGVSGEDRYPRWSPNGDRLFVARSRPLIGLPGLRLWSVAPDGSEARVIFADKRFAYLGFDLLPNLGPAPPLTDSSSVALDNAEVELAGLRSLGALESILGEDGAPLGVASFLFEGRERAAINVRASIPTPSPANLAELRVTVIAAVSRADSDTILRLGMHNAVENRFDTIVETSPADTDLMTLSFTVQSLQYIDRNRGFALQVIGDFSPGPQAELFIDHVAVDFRTIDDAQ